jgi:shikimate kinase
MPASGKSTLGRATASRTRRPFVDLDEVVEQLSGKSVREIFRDEGDYAFREWEHEALNHIASATRGYIVATGGGAPCYFANMDTMNQTGRTIYLNPSLRELRRRIEAQDEDRPLLAGRLGPELELFLQQLLLEREPYYLRALCQIQVDNATVEDVLACL